MFGGPDGAPRKLKGMRLLASWRPLAVIASTLAVAVPIACGSDDPNSKFGDGADAGSDGSVGNNNNIVFDTSNDAGPNDPNQTGPDASTGITMRIRDFKFYSATDSTTNMDFENPPYGINQSGNPQNGYLGDWDDPDIVTTALGSDNKPVYKPTGSNGKTLTTHGPSYFAQWFHDVSGTNIAQDIPLATSVVDGGTTEYDSNKSGQPQDPNNPNGMRGFFPIDDGTTYATTFGDQGKPHNYSFTGEIHAAFTFHGGEHFYFRGDDDVWVYINKHLVINIGGIHGPETKNVDLNDLGLTIGTDYRLDFFFAERHVTGSNVLFQTTLALRSAPPGGIK